MEAVRMPMTSFDVKAAADPSYFNGLDFKVVHEPISFRKPLQDYINKHYRESASTYSKEIDELEALRKSAVSASKDFVGCSTLKKYYAQLLLLQSRFPMKDGESAAVLFAWDDPFSGNAYEGMDIRFEQGCVLYNIGALHSSLGAMETRQNSESMKISCTHFQCSAWAYQHLAKEFDCSTWSPEMNPEVMMFLSSLMLAQAQECILEKSMLDQRKSTIVAKVAAQIVDYYHLLAKNLDSEVVAKILGSKKVKEYKRLFAVKTPFYKSIAHYFQGNQAQEQQKPGEAVAYFQVSADSLAESIKAAKGSTKDSSLAEALAFASDVVGGKVTSAKKDNDFIYHERIPEPDSLPEIKGAALVKGIPFDPSDPEISGPDIFAKLVPMKVHEASSLYSEEVAKLLRTVGSEIEEKNSELDEFLLNLDLETIKSLSEKEKLPQELLERCAAISVRDKPVDKLVEQMKSLSGLSCDVKDSLGVLEELVSSMPDDTPGAGGPADVKSEIHHYVEAHARADASNLELHRAMHAHLSNLRLLAGPLVELSSKLPRLEASKFGDDPAVQEMLRLADKLEYMKKTRGGMEKDLREKLNKRDVTKELVIVMGDKEKPDAAELESFFKKVLSSYDEDVKILRQNLSAQINVLNAVTDANAAYTAVRRQITEKQQRREAMIQSLIKSFDLYEDLLTKSQKGIEFYQKLLSNINKLLDKMKKQVSATKPQTPNVPSPNHPSMTFPEIPPQAVPYERDHSKSPHTVSSLTAPLPTEGMNAAEMMAMLNSKGTPESGGLKLKDLLPYMKPDRFGHLSNNKSPKNQSNTSQHLSVDGDTYSSQSSPRHNSVNSSMNPSANSSVQFPKPPDYSVAHNYPIHPSSVQPPAQNFSVPSVPTSYDNTNPITNVTPRVSHTNPANPIASFGVPRISNQAVNMPTLTSSTHPGNPASQGLQAHYQNLNVGPNSNNHFNNPSFYQPTPHSYRPAQNPGINGGQFGNPQFPSQVFQNPVQIGPRGPGNSVMPHAQSPPFLRPESHSENMPPQISSGVVTQSSTMPPQPTPAANNWIPSPGHSTAPLPTPSSYSGDPDNRKQLVAEPAHRAISSQVPGIQNSLPVSGTNSIAANLQTVSGPANFHLQPNQGNVAANHHQQPRHDNVTPNLQQQQMYGHVAANQLNQQQMPETSNKQNKPLQQSYYHSLPVPSSTNPSQFGNFSQMAYNQAGPGGGALDALRQAMVALGGPTSSGDENSKLTQNVITNQNESSTNFSPVGQFPPKSVGVPATTPQQLGPSSQLVYGTAGAMPSNFTSNAPTSLPYTRNPVPSNYYQSPGHASNTNIHPSTQISQPSSSFPQQRPGADALDALRQAMAALGGSPTSAANIAPANNAQSHQNSNSNNATMSPNQSQHVLQTAPTPHTSGLSYPPTTASSYSQLNVSQGQGNHGNPQSISPVPPTPVNNTFQQSRFLADPRVNPSSFPHASPPHLTPSIVPTPSVAFSTTAQQPPTPPVVAPLSVGSTNTAPQPAHPTPPTPPVSVPSGTVAQPFPAPSRSHVGTETVSTPSFVASHVRKGSLDDILSLSHSPGSITPAAGPKGSTHGGSSGAASVLSPKVVTSEEQTRQREEKRLRKVQDQIPVAYREGRDLKILEAAVRDFKPKVDNLTVYGADGWMREVWASVLKEIDGAGSKTKAAAKLALNKKNGPNAALPYDENRVVLQSIPSIAGTSAGASADDYINASWIHKLGDASPRMIVTQLPTPSSLLDFLVMLIQEDVALIACLANEDAFSDLQCPRYWPAAEGESLDVGCFVVLSPSVKQKEYFVERTLIVKNKISKKEHTLTQFQMTSWPSAGLPSTPLSFLRYLAEVNAYFFRLRSMAAPLMVQCTRGAGPSGVFAVLNAAVLSHLAGGGVPDLKRLVVEANVARRGLIEDKEQLVFCYQALSLHLENYLQSKGINFNPTKSDSPRASPKTHDRGSTVTTPTSGPVSDLFSEQPVSFGKILSCVSGMTCRTNKESPAESPKSSGDESVTIQPDRLNNDDCNASDPPLTNKERNSKEEKEIAEEKEQGGGESVGNEVHPDAAPLPTSLATALDPSQFSLTPSDPGVPVNLKKQRPSLNAFRHRDGADLNDPLTRLDPIWTDRIVGDKE